MNYEQKYHEALERANEAVKRGMVSQNFVDDIFGVESEDERIRKHIVTFLLEADKIGDAPEEVAKWLAYLEKLKDQKPVDLSEMMVHKEPYIPPVPTPIVADEQKPEHLELKAGHWYICHRAYCCRADHLTVKEGERFQCEKDGIVKGFVIKEPEKYFKQCSAPALMEDEQKEQKSINECNTHEPTLDEARKWNEVYEKGYSLGYENGRNEQKPAEWSEEDETILRLIHEALSCAYSVKNMDTQTCSVMREWLNNRLKSLRPKPQMLEDWTSEDDELLADVLGCITLVQAYKAYGDFKEFKMGHTGEELRSFVRSLKSRPRKQPHWKPSEEQMGALLNAEYLARANNYPENAKILANLYEQLKAL